MWEALPQTHCLHPNDVIYRDYDFIMWGGEGYSSFWRLWSIYQFIFLVQEAPRVIDPFNMTELKDL